MDQLVHLLDTSPLYLYTCLLLLGACTGSFLNVVAIRLPDRLFYLWRRQCAEPAGIDPDEPPPGILRPSSRCMTCSRPIRAQHNIPVLGYLLLRGKCGLCNAPFSVRYLLVELATAGLWALSGWALGPGWALVFGLVLVNGFIVLTLIDLDHQILPDIIVLPILWVGLGCNTADIFTSLDSAVIGAISGYLLLWTLYHVHRMLTGREGMGYGDFKLLACIGAWVGWELLPQVILTASVTGILVTGLRMMRHGHSPDTPVAFGPFLCLGGLAALLWGNMIPLLRLPEWLA